MTSGVEAAFVFKLFLKFGREGKFLCLLNKSLLIFPFNFSRALNILLPAAVTLFSASALHSYSLPPAFLLYRQRSQRYQSLTEQLGTNSIPVKRFPLDDPYTVRGIGPALRGITLPSNNRRGSSGHARKIRMGFHSIERCK